MEKLKPTYELAFITGNLSKLIFANSTLTGANEMGLTRPEMERVIVNFGNGDFHKSMTTHHDHKVWMDVYHGHTDGTAIYIKFVRTGSGEFVCTSFKEK
ncbi:MAG: type II toxin-antitoxin system MqsR family toxin [Rhodobacteraceae bacterium]|nr:type II toxin-antitoxin system MqsR family toxin [Paracoccaceae bacterium]